VVEIRTARSGEEDQILEAYEWLFSPPGTRPSGWERGRARDALARTIADGDAAVLVAQDRERGLVGVCTVYLGPESVRFGLRCWVEDLAVHPQCRSRGIGARLLAAAREWGGGRGATHLKLDSAEARKDAHRFYEREGGSGRSLSYTWAL
jgi:GNAT superfamily N-acetyltransferase